MDHHRSSATLGNSFHHVHSGPLVICLVTVLGVLGMAGDVAADWLDDANNRIDQYRKADFAVTVVDNNGSPVPGADVHIEMKRHTFGFGTAVTADLINGNSPNATTYKQKVLENFNQVVFENDLKWPAWDPTLWGGSSWNNVQNALNWLDTNDLPTRGHYASWAIMSGPEAWGPYTADTLTEQNVLDHISSIVPTVGNRVFEWDVINHPVGWFPDTYENRFGLDFYSDILDHARSVAPAGMPLWINEDDVIAGTTRADDYERIIEDMIDNGSSPDGIGFQGHFLQVWGRINNSPIDQIYDRIERFANFGLPLQVTEFDVEVGSNESLQGQLFGDYLTVMFSHPDMESVTLWGFWGGAHHQGDDGALYRTNWTEKPSLTAYQDLVFSEWWTDENGASNGEGEFDIRAFKGLYDITVAYDGQEYVLAGIGLDGDMSLEIPLPISVGLPGDYNGNNLIDAADYTVWRDALTAGSTSLPNDPTPGAVDESDFAYWRAHFGETLGSGAGAGSAAAAPEPTTLVMLLMGTLAILSRPSWQYHQLVRS